MRFPLPSIGPRAGFMCGGQCDRSLTHLSQSIVIATNSDRQYHLKWDSSTGAGSLDHLRGSTPATVHQVADGHQLEARTAVVRGNTLESGYMLLVPHTTALAQADGYRPCCRG